VVVPSGTRCPTSHYGLVAHFPSCSPVVVVVVVAHVFEQSSKSVLVPPRAKQAYSLRLGGRGRGWRKPARQRAQTLG
jgi:hypothetical protein